MRSLQDLEQPGQPVLGPGTDAGELPASLGPYLVQGVKLGGSIAPWWLSKSSHLLLQTTS